MNDEQCADLYASEIFSACLLLLPIPHSPLPPPCAKRGEIMSKTTRRDFIRTTSAAAAGAGLTNLNILRPDRVMGANGRVRVAIVGAEIGRASCRGRV